VLDPASTPTDRAIEGSFRIVETAAGVLVAVAMEVVLRTANGVLVLPNLLRLEASATGDLEDEIRRH
jgi:hypothetical protein